MEEEAEVTEEEVLTVSEGSATVFDVSSWEMESVLLVLSEWSTAESDVDDDDEEEEEESEEDEVEEADDDDDEEEEEEAEDEEADVEDVDEVLDEEKEEEAAEDELDDDDDDEEEDGAEAELKADDVPVGVRGGDEEGDEEAERFSRADVNSDFPFAKKLFVLFVLSTAFTLPSELLCPVGDAGFDATGVAVDEPAGDLTDGETGTAIGRSRGVGLLGFGCTYTGGTNGTTSSAAACHISGHGSSSSNFGRTGCG